MHTHGPTAGSTQRLDEPHTAAGRLHALLEKLRQASQGQPLFQVWATVLSVDATDVPAVLERIAQVGRLVVETRHDIESRLPAHRSAWYLEPYPAIEELVAFVQFSEHGSVHQRLSSTVMDRLMAAHMALADQGRAAGGRVLPESILSRFRAKADQLLGDVLADETLPVELRRMLVRHLEALRAALLHYQIDGVAGLEQAVTFAMGMSLREQVAVDTLRGAKDDLLETADTPPVVRRTWTLTKRVAKAVDWVREHPVEALQLVLSGAQVAIGAAQLAAGAPPAAVMLQLPAGPPAGSSPPMDSGMRST